jgi:hypothetical protein
MRLLRGKLIAPDIMTRLTLTQRIVSESVVFAEITIGEKSAMLLMSVLGMVMLEDLMNVLKRIYLHY